MDILKQYDSYSLGIDSLLQKTGFEPASTSCLKTKLYDVIPRYATSYRDAAREGNKRLIEIYEGFKKNNVEDQYQFVHVVLTDGEDNFSKITFPDFITEITEMKKKVGQKIKCYYIGLDLQADYNTKRELKKIAMSYGANGQFFEIDDSDIENIFLKVLQENHVNWQPVEMTSDIQQHQETYTAKGYAEQITTLKRLKYVVVFTLDCSGSMFGIKWTQVQASVVNFVNKLSAEDYVLGIVFNTGYTNLTFEDIQVWNQMEYDAKGNKTGTFDRLNQQSQQPIYEGYATNPQQSQIYQQPSSQIYQQPSSQVYQQPSSQVYQQSTSQIYQQSQTAQSQSYQYSQEKQIEPQQNPRPVETTRESSCCQLI